MLRAKDRECGRLAEERDRLATQLAEQAELLQKSQKEAETKETDLLAKFAIERSAWANKEAQLTPYFSSIEDLVDGRPLLFSFFESPSPIQADC